MRHSSFAFLIGSFAILSANSEETKSPKGSYVITQRFSEDGWLAVLHFFDNARADATLAADPDRCPWPSMYYISPDEQWVMRIQKIGSGENCVFLYHVEPNGRVSRMEQHLDDLAFKFLAQTSRISRRDFYHTGLDFVSWDITRHLLRFTVHGSRPNESGKGIERQLGYDWQKHAIVSL